MGAASLPIPGKSSTIVEGTTSWRPKQDLVLVAVAEEPLRALASRVSRSKGRSPGADGQVQRAGAWPTGASAFRARRCRRGR